MLKKTILIDLDGVLNEYSGKFEKNVIPKPKKNVIKFLEYLQKDYEIIVFTTRNLLLTSKWLIKNKLDIYVKDVSNIKRSAYLYLDDRALQFNGDYEEMKKSIETFKPYWE